MIYYQCRFYQTAPLRIGAGESEDSDSDVMTDIHDVPFIPGSAIAGVLRTYFSDIEAEWLFGVIREKTPAELKKGQGERTRRGISGEPNKTLAVESRVLISDAVLPHGCAYNIITRDGVGMNDRGTVQQGAKYDFEVVECTQPYTAVIELPDNPSEKHIDGTQKPGSVILEQALREIVRHGISFGARTTRGYGRMRVEIQKRVFQFPQDLKTWLTFNPMDVQDFEGVPLSESADTDTSVLRVHAQLQMEGSFSVRQYLAELPEEEKPENKIVSSVPLYAPVTNQQECPVIPGTSWAGVFRHHMRTLIQDAGQEQLLTELDNLFGVVEGSGKETVKRKSRIRFSETEVRETDSHKRGKYVVTRVAVERFTGAPRNQGLFSSLVAWGGEGELSIELPADTAPALRRLLAVALNDLHMGLLTAGGESSIGRGVCLIKNLTVNGKDVTEKVHACDTEYICVNEN